MKKIISVLLITFISCFIFSQTANVEELYNQAIKIFNNKEYDKAVELFGKVIQLKPDHYKAFYSRGKCFIEKKMFDEAINDFNQAIKINPKYYYAYCRRGIVYRQKGDFENAINEFKKSLDIKADYNDALRELAFVYILMEQFGKASDQLDKILNSKSKDSYANMYKGYIGYAKKKYKEADEYFSKAAAINSDNYDINGFYLINSFYISPEAFNNSLKTVINNKKLIKDQNGWDYSVLSFLTNETDEAELIKKTLNDELLLSEAFFFIGYKNLFAGNKDKASEYFKKCIEKNKIDSIYFAAAKLTLKNFN